MKPNRQKFALLFLASLLASPLQASLIHHYKLDETSGTAADDAVGTEDGTIGTSVTLGQPARAGTSFLFPAAAGNGASRVSVPAAVSPTGVGTAFSMSAFFNLSAALGNGGQMHIISGNNSAAGRWNLAIYDSDTTAGLKPTLLWFHNGGLGAVNYTAPISNLPGEWVHVGVTRDAAGLTILYLNGVGQEIGTSTASLASTPIGIGEIATAANFQFNGRIDDVRFYDNAITPTEMAALAALSDDSDNDGLPDAWELLHFRQSQSQTDAQIIATYDGTSDPDQDGFNNHIEFVANTDPSDVNSFPSGDSDSDGIDDGWEYLNFSDLRRDGYGDFDGDGSNDAEEFLATKGMLVARNANGSVAGTSAFAGSSNPKNANSQPNNDSDSLPDGYEYLNFLDLTRDGALDFDEDGFSDTAEFMANSLPDRKRSTPLNVHVTTRVAVAHNAGIAEYAVTDRVWTLVKQVAAVNGGVFGVTGAADGNLYATTQETVPRVIRVNPGTGEITTLATRNEGDALSAGWSLSGAQGIQLGPDGKLYFATAFSTAGEGVFRLNKDGTGFEQFIARIGGTEPDNWDLNNSRDLQWDGNKLYVSARGGFGAAGRPVYQFNAAGAFVTTLTSSLVGPQGLALDENGLLVTSTNGGTAALTLLNSSDTPPVGITSLSNASSPAGLDVIDLNGDTYTVTYITGAGVGQIYRNDRSGNAVIAVPGLISLGNGIAIFTSDAISDPYNDWAVAQGIDPNGPKGGPNEDFEGDGTSNRVEFALGLNPKSGISRFSVNTTGTPAAGQTLVWPSQPGISFQVRSSINLTDWSTIEATVVGQPAMTTASWTAPAALGAMKFYRVQFTP